MVTPELLDFILAGRTSGMSDEALTTMLVTEGGWNKEDVEEAFVRTLQKISPEPVPVEKSIAPVTKVEPVAPPEPQKIIEVAPIVAEVEERHPESTTPTISSEEDFLGIFHAPTQSKVFQAREVPTITPPHEAEIVSVPSQEVKSPQMPTMSIVPPLTPPEPVTPPVVSNMPPVVSVTTIQAPSPDEIILDVSESPPEIKKDSPIKFNFEKLRTTSPTPPLGTMVHQEKNAIADVLQQSSAPTPLTPRRGEDVIAKGLRMQKRTMASDILLQGVGQAPVAEVQKEVGTITSILEKTPTSAPSITIKARPTSPPAASSATSLADEVMRSHRIKRITAVAIGATLLLIGLGAVVFVLVRFLGPSAEEMLASAQQNFFGVQSFGYSAALSTELSVAGVGQAPGDTKSTINIAVRSSGNLALGANGYGDGAHRVILKGGIASGVLGWPTDVEIDMRIIGPALYFHLLSLPPTSTLDPDLFRTYWMKVDLAEIAKELALSGVVASQDGYGNFGGQGADATFNALLGTHTPFDSIELLSTENIDGVSAAHIAFHAEPTRALEFISALYRKYAGKELVLSAEERVRFLDALKKLNGEAWVNKETNTLMRIILSADLDDDLANVHVLGKVNIDIALGDWNAPSVIIAPTPILTLEELRVQMENYQALQEVRGRDLLKTANMDTLVAALQTYREAKGRYPTMLTDLYTQQIIASSTITEVALSLFVYAPYVNSSLLTAGNRCTTKLSTCAFYHIGIGLEEPTNSLLTTDSDLVSVVRGADARSCTGEEGFACYDRTPATSTPKATSSMSGSTTPTGVVKPKP